MKKDMNEWLSDAIKVTEEEILKQYPGYISKNGETQALVQQLRDLKYLKELYLRRVNY